MSSPVFTNTPRIQICLCLTNTFISSLHHTIEISHLMTVAPAQCSLRHSVCMSKRTPHHIIQSSGIISSLYQACYHSQLIMCINESVTHLVSLLTLSKPERGENSRYHKNDTPTPWLIFPRFEFRSDDRLSTRKLRSDA